MLDPQDGRTSGASMPAPAAVAAGPVRDIDPILLAAAGLFDRLGYEKVRLRDVAARSHVSKNTLYRHYPHKAALLTALVDTFAREFALHLTALTDRRHEVEVRRMCVDVCGGGGRGG